jgi:hypothetical protein
MGIAMKRLLTCGGFGIWTIIDYLIMGNSEK